MCKWKLSEPLAQQLLYLIWLLHVLIWPLPHLPVYDFFTSWYGPSLTYLSDFFTSWYGPSLTYMSMISLCLDMAPPSPTCLWFLRLLIWPLPHLPVYDFFTSWYGPSLTYLSLISLLLDMVPPSPTCLWPHLPVYDFWKIFGRHVWHTQKYHSCRYSLLFDYLVVLLTILVPM